MEALIRNMWGDPRNEIRKPLHIFFYLLSLPYGGAVRARNRLFDLGVLRQEKVGCPVVSVGNLTVGGTGKTPMVILLAGMLRDRGMRPAVLSRGYGGKSTSDVLVVSDGSQILAGPEEAGDEPVLIARRLKGIPVLAGAKRALTGRYARENFGVDVMVLDDGFQHRWIHRDLDIVLLDSRQPLGNGLLLPRGPLREPPSALERAGVVVFTRSEDSTGPLMDKDAFRDPVRASRAEDAHPADQSCRGGRHGASPVVSGGEKGFRVRRDCSARLLPADRRRPGRRHRRVSGLPGPPPLHAGGLGPNRARRGACPGGSSCWPRKKISSSSREFRRPCRVSTVSPSRRRSSKDATGSRKRSGSLSENDERSFGPALEKSPEKPL